jgi:hypothetical protein
MTQLLIKKRISYHNGGAEAPLFFGRKLLCRAFNK